MTSHKWLRFEHHDAIGFGILEDDKIDIHNGNMFVEPLPTGETVALDQVNLLTPVEPSKMLALANNYHALIKKIDGTVPEEPLYFFKANSSFHAHEQPIRRPQGYDGKIIFEGELGIVIGRHCKNVSTDQAMDYVFGYTCVNDVTSIELLNKDPSFQQWSRCKAADTFGVFGPCITTGLDPQNLVIKTFVDGQERQNYPVSDMVFDVATLVSSISHDLTLLPGDVIACGTSVGVGSMKPGNLVEINIQGIGVLSNTFEPDE